MRREQLYAAYGADAISLAGNAPREENGGQRTPDFSSASSLAPRSPGQRGRAHDNRDAGRSSCASYECSAPPSSHPIGAAATFLALAVLLAAVVGYDFFNSAFREMDRRQAPRCGPLRPEAASSPIEREFEEASACESGHEAASA